MTMAIDHELATRKFRLLVVDDEADMRMVLRQTLDHLGYQAEEAPDGETALEMLARTHFDLMIVDMQMPGLNGIQLLNQAHEHLPNLPVIILTGSPTLNSAIAAVKAGAVDYLLKPLNTQSLAQVVKRTLQRRSQQQKQEQLIRSLMDTLEHPQGLFDSDDQHVPDRTAPQTPSKTTFRLRVGIVSLDLTQRVVDIQGDSPRTIGLTEGETAVLGVLMEHPDQVHSCREIALRAWNYTMSEMDAEVLIRPYIFRLRRKLEESSAGKWILTLRGRGYRFTPPK